MNDYLEKVIGVICDCTGMSDESMDDESTLKGDCGLDSLDLSEIALMLEEEFDVEIDDETIEGWNTIHDICQFLEKNAPKRDED